MYNGGTVGSSTPAAYGYPCLSAFAHTGFDSETCVELSNVTTTEHMCEDTHGGGRESTDEPIEKTNPSRIYVITIYVSQGSIVVRYPKLGQIRRIHGGGRESGGIAVRLSYDKKLCFHIDNFPDMPCGRILFRRVSGKMTGLRTRSGRVVGGMIAGGCPAPRNQSVGTERTARAKGKPDRIDFGSPMCILCSAFWKLSYPIGE